MMIIARSNKELHDALEKREVGFVPTMGALHQGHLSLVRASKARGLFTVVSIFVNPTQFNDPADFEKYPIDIEGDITKLRSVECDLVFLPSKEDVYPPGLDLGAYTHDFGELEKVFEGAFRPGHFRGVAQVVHRFFELVRPKVAFFGEKDFQQLVVIRRLVKRLNQKIEIVGMPTMRENDGLAMSSRNMRLSQAERQKASTLFEMLDLAKKQLKTLSLEEIRAGVVKRLASDPDFSLEYFELINGETLRPAKSSSDADRAIIACFLGEVRLIDNMSLS